jgi:hypothetical protein
VACAGVSIIVWVFNWICWLNQCCCCDFLHNSINKRLVWWTSFIFFLGILACCISGFVTVNRFGFAINGSYCSFERFYYDSKFGQLKDTYPKWEGFTFMKNNLQSLKNFVGNFTGSSNLYNDLLKKGNDIYLKQLSAFDKEKKPEYNGYFSEEFISNLTDNDPIHERILPIIENYRKIVDSTYNLVKLNKNFSDNIKTLYNKFYDDNSNSNDIDSDFDNLKSKFIQEFYYFARIANGWCRILTTIYFSLLLTATTFACVSMMFYSCLRRQGYLSVFMHVLWNIIRFFMFSFFFYGAAYGMGFLGLRDAVIFVKFVFGEENLDLGRDTKSYLIPTGKGKEYLNYCLINNTNDYKNQLNNIVISSLEDFFGAYSELVEEFKIDYSFKKLDSNQKLNTAWNDMHKFMKTNLKNKICIEKTKNICEELSAIAKRKGGLFGSYDCSFLKRDLDMMFRTVYDAAIESRILCALSCCIGFFGAIAVYFFLLVIHHYDNELFYDAGQSNFIGFEGFGNKRNDISKNPAYKKRKIRSEIELSSRNDQYSGN